MVALRIKFSDFWYGFKETDNYFYHLLSEHYHVEISDDPEIVVYSSFGHDFLKYKCIRIFFTGENFRPDFRFCDYAIGFDFLDHPRYYRFPLYVFYIDYFKAIPQLLSVKSPEEALKKWREKKKFCCFIVSNPKSKKRIDFFHKLSQYKHVDSGGTVLNNIGGPIKDKVEFIKDYRFVLSFENAAYPGYTTEKIVEPLIVDSIPVYWGNPFVSKDFNKSCYLDMSDFDSEEALIKEMLEIDSDEKKAVKYLTESKFPGNALPECVKKENLFKFFDQVISNRSSIRPVAKTLWRFIHNPVILKNKFVYKLNQFIKELKTR